jgi:hypothetical protein
MGDQGFSQFDEKDHSTQIIQFFNKSLHLMIEVEPILEKLDNNSIPLGFFWSASSPKECRAFGKTKFTSHHRS